MKNIIIDTNFLIECAKRKIDIQKELRRILDENFKIGIIDKTIDELNVVMAKGKKEGTAAKLAMTILLTKKFIIYPSGRGHTDTQLVKRADADHIVATADAGLKRKLRAKKQPVIVIRGPKKLAIVGK